MLGAKVPDETLLRKGMKLAKVREESLQNILKPPKGRECNSGGPVKGPLDARLLPAGRDSCKKEGGKPQFAFGRLVSANPPERKIEKNPSLEAASKERIARKSKMDNESKRPLKAGSHVPPPPKAKTKKNMLGPQGEVMHKL